MLDESEKLIVMGDQPASFCTTGARQEGNRVQCLWSYIQVWVSFQKHKNKDYSWGGFFEDEDCSSTWRAGTGLTPTYSSALRITDACWMKCSGCKWFLLAQYVITLSLTLKEETKNCFDKWFETLPSFTGFVLLSVCTSCFSCKAISSCPKTMLCRELQYNKL